MYALISDRNKQYLVKENCFIKVDFIDVAVNSIINIYDIIFYNNGDNITFGSPFVKDFVVKLEVVNHFKLEKKIALKFRRRKHHIKRIGNRQKMTTLKVIFIGNK